MMEVGSCLSDEEFIDVENGSDNEQTYDDVAGKTISSVGIFDDKQQKVESNNHKTSQKSSNADKFKKLVEETDNFFPRKSMIPPLKSRNTSNVKDVDRKNELNNILFEIMNKLFSARVVLKRLPNPVFKKIKSAQQPITRNSKKKTLKQMRNNEKKTPKQKEMSPVKKSITKNKEKETLKSSKIYRIREGTAYKRVCPKCKKPPAIYRTRECLSCKIELAYQCQKCHEQFKNYKRLFQHQETKCSIRGYYHCYICDFKAIAACNIKHHSKIVHPSVKYNKKTLKWTDAKNLPKSFVHNCSQCGKQFVHHEHLNRHIPHCMRAKEFVNSTPDEQLRINKDFQKMIIRICQKCEDVTKVYDSGVSKLPRCQKCKSAMQFKCLKCNREYHIYGSVLSHTKTCDGVPRKRKLHPRYSCQETINCPHCDKPFLQEKWLNKHLLRCPVLRTKPNAYQPLGRHTHLKATCKNCNTPQSMCDRPKYCYKCKSDLWFR